jgi:hypothetical protein
MRWSVTAVLTASLALVVAAPASAGTVSTPNVCHYSAYPGFWFGHTIDLSGVAAPNPVAPGSGVALTQGSVHARLPDWVVEYATNLQIFQPGENQVAAKVWLALAGAGTPQGVQVLALETVARTTVTTNADGSYASSTPLDVTIPLPDTAWTAPGSGAVAWRQADAGSLAVVPAGTNGANVTPKGSVLISAKFDGGIGVVIDCRPGTEVAGRTTFTALTAGAFETAPLDAGAPAALKPPVVSLRTTKLKRSGRRVRIAIACADAPCTGTVSLGRAARRASYSLAAGARTTLRLTLSSATVRKLRKKPLRVTVKVTAAGAKTVSKQLRLK